MEQLRCSSSTVGCRGQFRCYCSGWGGCRTVTPFQMRGHGRVQVQTRRHATALVGSIPDEEAWEDPGKSIPDEEAWEGPGKFIPDEEAWEGPGTFIPDEEACEGPGKFIPDEKAWEGHVYLGNRSVSLKLY